MHLQGKPYFFINIYFIAKKALEQVKLSNETNETSGRKYYKYETMKQTKV